jgi:hypothetical protein
MLARNDVSLFTMLNANGYRSIGAIPILLPPFPSLIHSLFQYGQYVKDRPIFTSCVLSILRHGNFLLSMTGYVFFTRNRFPLITGVPWPQLMSVASPSTLNRDLGGNTSILRIFYRMISSNHTITWTNVMNNPSRLFAVYLVIPS